MNGYSNTSHVIVYPGCLLQVITTIEFKYISCYCLSQPQLQINLYYMDSNTSHVIVYHGRAHETVIVDLFKYISCYCLSQLGGVVKNNFHKFKYISCYCLSSSCPAPGWHNPIQIHLMLLFIRISSFSHLVGIIQIHLMLLFIFNFVNAFSSFLNIQIHLMLLFIDLGTLLSLLHASIQIHLMLLFIKISIKRIAQLMGFKYISCYCLSCQNFHCLRCRLFKYISCYCLSILHSQIEDIAIHSNTSHVIVYRECSSRIILTN